MTIDFTGLNKLFSKPTATDNFTEATEEPLEAHTDDLKDDGIEISLEAIKTAVEERKQPYKEDIGKKALINLQREQENNKRTLEIYTEYQKNIRTSESLQTEILKGARAGDPVELLFLKAVECISCMTSDKLFYNQIEKDLIKIYGEAFLDPIPLEWELDKVKERLKNLQEYRAREDATDTGRVDRAIEAHKAKISKLETIISKAGEEKKIAI